MDWYAELLDIMPPPPGVHAPAPGDWAAAEAALGLRLPDDFKRYAGTWGSARVGDLFTCAPAQDNPNTDLVGNARAVSRALGTLRADFPHKYTAPVWPEPGGFLANGRSGNGDYLGWIVTGTDPDAWPAAVWGDEEGAPEVFEGTGFGDFMLGIVTGRLRPQALPDDLWDRIPLTAG